MEDTNAEMQKIVEKIEQVAPQIEFDPIILDQKPHPLIETDTGTKVIPKDVEFREVNDRQFLVHKVIESDSLMRLSLKYNVSIRLIKNCNNLVDDQVYHKRELLIPVVEGFVMRDQQPLTEEQEKQKI